MGQVCLTVTGECIVPECTQDVDCPDGELCEVFRCVKGCLNDSDCDKDQKCFEQKCVPRSENCDCPKAPSFCTTDQNPVSSTFGKELCVPSSFENGVALFFGSVLCSHCRTMFGSLSVLASEVGGSTGPAGLVWVHLETVSVVPSDVEKALGTVDESVVFDTDALAVWDRYAADWYHMVIVDRNGCLAGHFGPLSQEQIDGSLRQEIGNAWADAALAECTVPVPEMADSAEPATDVMEPPEILPAEFPGDEAPEPVTDLTVGETTETIEIPDAADGKETEEFILAETCQIVMGFPIGTGDPVPHFLCMDVNPSSGQYGQGISDVYLKELIWIAYFGSCT